MNKNYSANNGHLAIVTNHILRAIAYLKRKSSDIDWSNIFSGADLFHITGITPAISKNEVDFSLEAVKTAFHTSFPGGFNIFNYYLLHNKGCCFLTVKSKRNSFVILYIVIIIFN